MKIIVLFIFLFSTGMAIMAQEVVSSAGETQAAEGYQLSWTIGEPVIETISSGTNTLTQGFHQTKLTITAVTELMVSEIEIKVFPNPTHDFVLIQFNELPENSSFSLFNLSGKIVKQQIITSTKTRLNLNSYASGSYILRLSDNKQQPLQTFKIIKK